MIRYSDNNAAQILKFIVGEQEYSKTFIDLGIEPQTAEEDYINVKTYASFFRILFNASYLNIEMSERALKLLSETTFDAGLRAGVPKNITVSHKYGEREKFGNNKKQLHDCGIVYYPGHPYLVCIMSRGQDYNTLVEVLREISQKIYEQVSKQ